MLLEIRYLLISQIRYLLSKKLDEKMIFAGYIKVVVLNLLDTGNIAFIGRLLILRNRYRLRIKTSRTFVKTFSDQGP